QARGARVHRHPAFRSQAPEPPDERIARLEQTRTDVAYVGQAGGRGRDGGARTEAKRSSEWHHAYPPPTSKHLSRSRRFGKAGAGFPKLAGERAATRGPAEPNRGERNLDQRGGERGDRVRGPRSGPGV